MEDHGYTVHLSFDIDATSPEDAQRLIREWIQREAPSLDFRVDFVTDEMGEEVWPK